MLEGFEMDLTALLQALLFISCSPLGHGPKNRQVFTPQGDMVVTQNAEGWLKLLVLSFSF